MLLDGVDYTAYVDQESMRISSSVTVMSSTSSLSVMIPGQAVPRPKAGMEIAVESLNGVEFGGHVVQVDETQTVPNQLDYKLTCRDYSWLLNRHVAFNEFAADTYTYDQIVRQLVNQYAAADGFTAAGVQASYEAVYTRFDYQPVADSINQLAQQIAWAFYVDYQRDVFFYDGTTTLPSPLAANTLLVDTATTVPDSYGVYGQLGVYGDLKISEDVSQLRNRIFLYGQNVTSTAFITETFAGDGQTATFGLSYPPSQDLVNNVIVTVGGALYICMTDLVDGMPTATAQDYKAYVNFTQQTVRFNVAPPAGVNVVVKYKPQIPIVLTVPSPTSAAAIAEIVQGTDGYFEYAISDPTLTGETIGPSQARADEQIVKYGLPHISGSFTSFLHGWRAGQYFLVTSSRRFDGQFSSTPMYVTKVEKQMVSHPASGGATQPLFKSTVSFSNNVYVI